MISRPAQYLLRFDDLCPTMNRSHWSRFNRLIVDSAVKPILAIVPANADRDLAVDAPDPDFWPQMRALESAGAAIALHGYAHLCASSGRSLLAMHKYTEFAGVPATLQRQWIRDGLHILRSQSLKPRLFVAPRHGYDRNTLQALKTEGIHAISDGFARDLDLRDGVIRIPQQLWAPASKSAGLWTICIHPNTASEATFVQLSAFLEHHADRFTSLDHILSETPISSLGTLERFYEKAALWRYIARRRLRTMQPLSRRRLFT